MSRLSRRKKAAFVALLVVLVLVVSEIGARIIESVYAATRSRGERLHEFVDYQNPVKVFTLVDEAGRKVYRRTEDHTINPGEHFPADKGERTIRVFCLGGSAAQGWPHDPPDSFPGLLQRKLQLVLPDWNIEVINAAGWSYASHRVRFVFDEIIEYDPDLIVVYSGNNEFLEKFVYEPRSLGPSGPWKHFAIARVIHRALRGGAAPKVPVDVKNFNAWDQVATRLSWAFGQASRLRRDPQQFEQVKAHYAYNIESMVTESKRRQVPIFLLTVPGNLKDWIPNVSVHGDGLSAAEIDRWQRFFREGVLALERDDFRAARAALDQAARISPAHAETHYHLARAHYALGNLSQARAGFIRALEEDAYPFRPLPQFNRILREIARTHDVELVDAIATLERQTADGIIGLDVLIDYVHPTVASNELISQTILVQMQRSGLLPEELAVPVELARIEIPPDVEESEGALRGLYIQNLVMRQYDKLDSIAARITAKLRAMVDAQPGFRAQAQTIQASYDDCQKVIRPYRRLLRAEKLGILEEEFSEPAAQQTFADYVELIQRLEGLDMAQERFDAYVPEQRFGRKDKEGVEKGT